MVLCRLVFFIAACLWVCPNGRAAGGEETFDVLKTRTGTYTNVTVTTKARDYVFILHSTGMANIKISDLPFNIKEKLGYAPANKTNELAAIASKALPGIVEKIQPIKEEAEQEFQAQRRLISTNPLVAYGALAVSVILYLFFCYCCSLICLKAKKPAGVLVWIPGLQFIPLLQAAGMSGWWFLACLVPVVNVLVQIVWSFKVAKAREKSPVIGLALILPVVNLLAFLYLAFSSTPVEKAPPQKFRSMSLQTA